MKSRKTGISHKELVCQSSAGGRQHFFFFFCQGCVLLKRHLVSVFQMCGRRATWRKLSKLEGSVSCTQDSVSEGCQEPGDMDAAPGMPSAWLPVLPAHRISSPSTRRCFALTRQAATAGAGHRGRGGDRRWPCVTAPQSGWSGVLEEVYPASPCLTCLEGPGGRLSNG